MFFSPSVSSIIFRWRPLCSGWGFPNIKQRDVPIHLHREPMLPGDGNVWGLPSNLKESQVSWFRWVWPGLGCCVVAATPGWCLMIWGYWQNLADISWDILGIIIIATHLKSLSRFWRCPISSFQLFATYPGTWDDCLGLGKIGQPGGKISYCWYVLYIYISHSIPISMLV